MMNLPALFFLLRCLAWDTFRRALATRTFWLMASVTLVCVVFCLGVHVEGGAALKPEGEIELFGGDNQPLTGPNPAPGHITLGFGLVRLPLFRDAEAEVRFLQILLAFWVAGAIGTLATLIWTAGFLPEFLDPGSASVLLAKPAPRWVLLIGKFFGVLAFVAFQGVLFFGGTWLALGLRTGVWPAEYWLGLPLLLLQFAMIYSFSVLMAVYTRSTAAAIFGALLFWFVCYAANFGRHAVVALPYLDTGMTPYSPAVTHLAEISYWVLPKPGDCIILLDSALQAREHFNTLPAAFRTVIDHGAFQPELSVLSSLLFSAVLLGFAAWQFAETDY